MKTVLLYFKVELNGSFGMFIIRSIPEQKYFADIKHVIPYGYCYCWFTWSEWFCHRISLFNAEVIHATNGFAIEEDNIIVYISGYICRKVSRSACDQCKVILMPIINCIHFCLGSNIRIVRAWGFCSTSKLNTISISSNERIFGNIPDKFYIWVIKEIKDMITCKL